MPSLSLIDTAPPSNIDNDVRALLVDDDTFEGFHPRMENHLSQLKSQPDVLQPSEPTIDISDSNPKIIIIEPVPDSDGPNARPLHKFFANEISTSTALANSPFGKAGISHITRNPKRQLLVVTMKKDCPTNLNHLLQITNLGSWQVKCRLPLNQTICAGVIGPVGEDISNEELTTALRESGNTDVTAERILKGKEQTKTSMFKINFPSSNLPEYLYVGYQRFKVSPYVAKPWQCYRCQDFGHSAISCKGPPRCVACAGAHSVKDCTITGNPRCCNCNGPHTASYGGCPRMKQAKQVEKVRSYSKLSYRDALKVVRSSPQNSSLNPKPSGLRSPVLSTKLANHLGKSKSVDTGYRAPTCTVSTQTENVLEKPTLQNVPVCHLIKLLSKLLSLCKPNANIDFLDVVTKLTRDALHLEEPSGRQAEQDPPQNPGRVYLTLDEVPLLELPLSATDEEMTEALIQPSPVLGAPPRRRAATLYGKSPVIDSAALEGGSNQHSSKSKTKSTIMTKNVEGMQFSKCQPRKK